MYHSQIIKGLNVCMNASPRPILSQNISRCYTLKVLEDDEQMDGLKSKQEDSIDLMFCSYEIKTARKHSPHLLCVGLACCKRPQLHYVWMKEERQIRQNSKNPTEDNGEKSLYGSQQNHRCSKLRINYFLHIG